MVKIAVTGAFGRMGQTIIKAIEQTDGMALGVKLDKGDDLNAVLDQFEVLIDFTRPEATLDYLAICLSANKAMVIGTMGFNDAGLTNLNNAKN